MMLAFQVAWENLASHWAFSDALYFRMYLVDLMETMCGVMVNRRGAASQLGRNEAGNS